MSFARAVLLVFILCLVCACAGCADPQKDAENKKKVETLLARLPQGWKADVEVKGDTLTIRNFAAMWPMPATGASFDLAFDELTAEGVDFDTDGAPGKPPLKKLTVRNLRDALSADPGLGVAYTHSIGLLEVNTPEGDFAGALAVLDGKAEPETLLKTLLAWKTGAAKVENEVQDVSYKFFGMTTKIGRYSVKSASLLRWEGYEMADLSLRALGVEVFALESAGCRLIQIPDIVTPVSRHVESSLGQNATAELNEPFAGDGETGRLLRDALRANPIKVEGVFFSNMRIRPMTTDAAIIGRIDGDLFLTPESLRFAAKATGLDVPASVLAPYVPLGDIGLRMGESLRGEFSQKVEMRAGEKGGTGVCSLDLRLAEWGAADIVVDVLWPENPDFPTVPGKEDNLLIKGFSVGHEDLGGIDKILARQGESREGLIAALKKEPWPGFGAEVQKALLTLVEKGGKVRLVVTCDPPEPASAFLDKQESMPATWKVVLEHIPPAKK